MVTTVRGGDFREECNRSHACPSFKRTCVGSNGILECKILSKNEHRTGYRRHRPGRKAPLPNHVACHDRPCGWSEWLAVLDVEQGAPRPTFIRGPAGAVHKVAVGGTTPSVFGRNLQCNPWGKRGHTTREACYWIARMLASIPAGVRSNSTLEC
jgi:hypothetical protein